MELKLSTKIEKPYLGRKEVVLKGSSDTTPSKVQLKEEAAKLVPADKEDRQAYAFLLYPDKRALSEIAMKRLQIISDFTELGSGFKIAMEDLKIRGAGNLLGVEQSGHISAVGFDLYCRLLREAVSRLKQGLPATAPLRENQPMVHMS